MIEVLPIKFLTEADANIFGKLNVLLARLKREGLPVAEAIVVTPPSLKLKTTLEYFDLKSKEIFEQTLELIKNEIKKIPIPENLEHELKKYHQFLIGEKEVKAREVWHFLLFVWLEEIKQRLFKAGFSQNLTQDLEPQLVTAVDKIKAYGLVFFDPITDDSVIKIGKGGISPKESKELDDLVKICDKKLFMQYQYEWIVDDKLKISRVLPYPSQGLVGSPFLQRPFSDLTTKHYDPSRSTVKVFLEGFKQIEFYQNINGIYITSENIFDLDKPRETFEDLTLTIIESASLYPHLPILVKLPDKSEGMGKIRGSLRLIHQKSLFEPAVESLIFVRNKHKNGNLQGHSNVHIVIPFVRGLNEFLQIKRELAVKKLSRKNSLEFWLEVAVPENIINLEDYLVAGLDGVVLNLDELIAHLNGFDHTQQDLVFYKSEVGGLLKFLEDGLKLLHKSKIPFIVYGSITLYPHVLEYLVEKGVYGVVVDKYEALSANTILHQIEKRLILKRF